MVKVNCEKCKAEFEAKRVDAHYCPPCKIIATRERGRRYDKGTKYPCIECGETKVDRHSQGGRCRQCRNRYMAQFNRGENNPTWKGGRSMRKGYPTVLVDGKHQEEHRIVWAEANGPIPEGYVIHHMNGVKHDNRLENLLAVPRNQHHSEPHKVIALYEARIKSLEEQLAKIQ